jgi:exopolyphosphatase/guanosine-5'-triphosphate,3'-diphosphate pyrophosphatase
MKTYAAIDVGTNSVRLLVADIRNRKIHTLTKDLITTRIGEGMATSRYLKQEAILRTVEAIVKLFRKAQQLDSDEIYVFATSAVRDASNKEIFVSEVQNRLGIIPEIISGEKEAKLSFLGATAALSEEKLKETVVIDIGGGSTEIIFKKNTIHGVSMPMGAVRLAEKPLCAEDLTQLFIQEIKKVPYKNPFVVGVGGTVTSLAAIAQVLQTYDSTLIHGYKLTTTVVMSINTRLHEMTLPERQKLPGLDPKRADIIPYGSEILVTLLGLLGADTITVSESDILEGRILAVLEEI